MKAALVAAAVGLACGISGADDGRTPPAAVDANGRAAAEQPISIDFLLNPPSKATTGVNGLRANMVNDAGKTVGFRAGMANRAAVLVKSLHARSAELDAIFQFSTLVRKDGTIPPVIVEATDVASFTADQFRFAGQVYRIEKDERFVSVPPTWRNYLLAGLALQPKVDLPDPDARPNDSGELKVWQEAVRSGWERGEREADAVLDANFNRLARDYAGMILYSPLVAVGIIIPTQVAELTQAVTGDGRQITLNDTLRRVTAKARFEPNGDKWVPVVKPGAKAALRGGDGQKMVAPNGGAQR